MVAQSEAARLFALRAVSVLPSFSIADHSEAVARVCWQLDGIPLALELAAAWVGVVSVEQLPELLNDIMRSPRAAQRLAPARQRTLTATFEWSYSLLSRAQQRLLPRVSVFVGGWTLEACEEVCSDARASESDARPTIDQELVLSVLADLVDKSLVLAEPGPDGMRYRMLEPQRQFALDVLATASEVVAMRRRHAQWYLALAVQAAQHYHRPGETAALERVAREHANLQAALESLIASGEGDGAARMVSSLWWFWLHRNHWLEARTQPERLLNHASLRIDGPARTLLFSLAAATAWLQGDLQAANRWIELGLATGRKQKQPGPLGAMLAIAGQVMLSRADSAAARRLFEEGLPLSHGAGDHWNETRMLDGLARLALVDGEMMEATRFLEQCVDIARATGDDWTLATVLNSLGDVARSQADYPRARRLYEESLRRFELLHNVGQRPSILHNLAYVALHQREIATSTHLFGESLALFIRLGDQRGVAECLVGLGCVAASVGRPDQAARLFGACEATFQRLGTQLSGSNQSDYRRHLQTVQAGLRPGAYSAAWKAGAELPLDGAVEEALQFMARQAPEPRPKASMGHPIDTADDRRGGSGLTPREREVVDLVRREMSNRQIGEALVITEGTASLHVKHVLSKLGFRSRAQLAAWAASDGSLSTP